jgi:2-polyprenyl-6-methoxyphenol hydroxylase-like FAD-dependent oxidoreductase
MAGAMGEHAVVLGASMAGLLAARALTESFERVTVVERDVLPTEAEHRRGVPQGRHVHVLLARGGQALDGLLPGLTEEVIAAGAPVGDLLANVRWFLSGYRISRTEIGQPVLFAGRPLLEGHVRARVRALPGVTFADGHDVVDLVASPDRRSIIGVRIQARGEDGGEGGAGAAAAKTIACDLVLDATGRGSRTPLWLEGLGYRKPVAEKIHIGLGYASRSYRLRPDALGSDGLILHSWTPKSPRAAALVVQEGGRHLLTVAGLLGDYPPTDPAAFDAFVSTLQFPDVQEALRDSEPLDDPIAFQYPANVRQRYERLRDFPAGLLVLGDAVCSFNPIYGQGMTSSAMQAEALHRLLLDGRPFGWRRYFQAIAKLVNAPWDITTGADLAFPGVEGRRTAKVRLVNAYVPRLHAAATTDRTLAAAFVRVTGLLDRPEALLRPDRALRVLTHRGRGRAH